MLILKHEDIIQVDFDISESIKWVDTVLREKRNTILPAKISLHPEDDVFYNTMPSLLPTMGNIGGVKVVNRYPKRIPSLDSKILLYDCESGDLLSILDGNYITALRTGAVAAHSIKLLAKKNSNVFGFIGLGNQARSTYKVLNSIYKDNPLTLKLFRYKDQNKIFNEYIQSLPYSENRTIEVSDSYEGVVEESDVVVSSVTYFDSNICDDNCFKKGCLIVPIHTRGFMNCDLFFDKFFADDIAHVKGFKYFDCFSKYLNEVSDIVLGVVPGRESDMERIMVYNIGLSIHDIFFANQIYLRAKQMGLGQETDLNAPKEKFWFK